MIDRVCGAVASRADCTRAATAPRALRIRERAHYTALQTARARQQTDTFKQVYARRLASKARLPKEHVWAICGAPGTSGL